MYRPLGEGDVDFVEIMSLLDRARYSGWFVIEQDLVINSPSDAASPLSNARRSIQYLESVSGT